VSASIAKFFLRKALWIKLLFAPVNHQRLWQKKRKYACLFPGNRLGAHPPNRFCFRQSAAVSMRRQGNAARDSLRSGGGTHGSPLPIAGSVLILLDLDQRRGAGGRRSKISGTVRCVSLCRPLPLRSSLAKRSRWRAQAASAPSRVTPREEFDSPESGNRPDFRCATHPSHLRFDKPHSLRIPHDSRALFLKSALAWLIQGGGSATPTSHPKRKVTCPGKNQHPVRRTTLPEIRIEE